jgi:cytochrome P450
MTELGSDFSAVNFFKDRAVQDDPYPYYEWLRAQGPVWQEPKYGIYMVSGYEEALSVYRNAEDFSNCNTVAGPFTKWPVPLEGDDISAIIEEYRDGLPFSDQLPSFDPPRHTEHRALMMRLLTPKRLADNEAFMWQLCDRKLDELLPKGDCEFISEYAAPFTLLVIAELEGVPESDFGLFESHFGQIMSNEKMSHKPLEFLYDQFTLYIEERRRTPRADIMTGMASATFSDGSVPDVKDVALIAANLFAGGQETTVRLLSFALRMLGERQDLQERLRGERDRIPNFIDETLRLESPLRGQFRLARRQVQVGEVGVPPGSSVLLLPGAANRDPREFPDPDTFDVERPNARRHLAFGHGTHLCAGASLARAEGRVTVNRLFDRTSDITISESAHGPAGNRTYDYLPTYLFRGLVNLHVELRPS